MRPTVKAGLALASTAFALTPLAASPAGAAQPQNSVIPRGLLTVAPALDRAVRAQQGPDAVFPIAGKADYGTEVNLFGNNRGDHIHAGQDVFAPAGTKLVAIRDGVVVEAGSDGGRGNYAYIYSPKANETYGYFHMLEAPHVRQGQKVRAGERVGSLGCTGSCSGDHLHFEVRAGRDPYGAARDPLPLLKKLD